MFDQHITDFNKSLLGLREFVDLIDPFLTEKQDFHRKGVAAVMQSGVLNAILRHKTDWKAGEREEMQEMKSKFDAQILEIYKRQIEVDIEAEKETEQNKQEIEAFRLKVKLQSIDQAEIIEDLEKSSKSSAHKELLYKNSLISLLSSVEWFFAQILHYYYDKFPDSAGISKKTMTLSDLKGFGSIEDAEKYLIDVKIEEILRGSFDSWVTLLKTDLSLKLSWVDNILDELIEIYQRRNLLVHNGGVVNSIYLNKVRLDLRKDVKQGETLNVTKEYLDNAICKLQKVFILIGSELWKKLDKGDKKRGDVLIEIVYENLLKSRWDICEGLSYFVMHDTELEPIDKVVSQLNYWLCLKRTNRLDEAKKDLDKADYSDKKEIFQLGLMALKGNEEDFFKILPYALDSAQLNIERLEEFPIFEEMRGTEKYRKFKEQSKYFKEPNQEILKLE